MSWFLQGQRKVEFFKQTNNLEVFLEIQILRLGVSCAFMDKRERNRDDNSGFPSDTTRGFA